jgi:hypothetical protein
MPSAYSLVKNRHSPLTESARLNLILVQIIGEPDAKINLQGSSKSNDQNVKAPATVCYWQMG